MSIQFEVTGTDKDVYNAPASLNFNANEAQTDTAAGAISSWGVGTCGLTSCTMTPTVTKVGTLWWAINAAQNHHQTTEFADATCPTKETIMQYAARSNVPYTDMTADQQANADITSDSYSASETGPADGETWTTF